MLKWLLHKSLDRFERKFQYDASYMHDITEKSLGAGLRLTALPFISQFKGPYPDVWAGALLASTLEGDCGPCAQLVVDTALEAGVSADKLYACTTRDFERAGAAGLGFQFAEASIQGREETDTLRDEIIRQFGDEALFAAAFAAATGRAYPVLKRAVGHGAACHTLHIGHLSDISVRKAA